MSGGVRPLPAKKKIKKVLDKSHRVCYNIATVKERFDMTREELMDKLNSWTDRNGWDRDSLWTFVNIYATSYEEYVTIWHILDDILLRMETV
jgi:hypothetical protein